MLRRSLILNMLLALILVGGLVYLFFNSLNWITNHGKEIEVPKLTSKNLNDALVELENLDFKVQVDSTYKSYIDPLQVLQQEPEVGSRVKVGRTIFLLVNRQEAPKVEMPDLVSKSFRNAVLILKSYRFVIGDTIYKPDIAVGAVLEQRINGKLVAAGSQVPFGSRIDLVVGEGLADYEVDVPNLIGKTWREAREIIKSAGLFDATLWEGNISDSEGAIVYKQFPEALNELDFPNAIRGGDMIDVQIMQDPTPQLLRQNAPGSLKFQDLDDSVADVIQSRLDNASFTLRKKKKPTFSEGDDNAGTNVIGGIDNFDEGAPRKKKSRRKVKKTGFKDESKSSTKKKKKSSAKPKEVIKETNDQDFGSEYD